MKRLFIYFVLLTGTVEVFSQDPPVILTANTIYDDINGTAETTVYVKNFKNIISMQFTINFPEGELDGPEINALQLPVTSSNFSLSFPDFIGFAWVAPNAIPISLDDNSPAFSVKFNRLTNAREPVCLSGSPVLVEVASLPARILPYELNCTVEGRLLNGKIYNDIDGDCLLSQGETGLSGWNIFAEGNGSIVTTLSLPDGSYNLFLAPGDYSLSIEPPQNYWLICPQTDIITIDTNQDTFYRDFGTQPTTDCPIMQIDIATPFLRRCRQGEYNVKVCNIGTAPASDAYAQVILDPYFFFRQSDIPPSLVDGDSYTFELGHMAVNECRIFTIKVEPNCPAIIPGQTHCVKAYAYPDIPCDTAQIWSGPHLKVSGECTGNSVVFEIENTGQGNMQSSENYKIIEDAVKIKDSLVQLEAGESEEIILPANGSTYRIQVNQVPDYPGKSRPTLAIEGCGTNDEGTISTGFVTLFPEDDAETFIDIHCRQNISSWDPNDIQVFPKGYDFPGYIETNTDLEYLIRFQNTGTDTAFDVYILDTLPEYLDMASIHPGASSHSYVFDTLGNNVIRFKFDNIHLPDSTANEPESHGFVNYRISQMPDLLPETEIFNKAAIYFDSNPAVITNTVLNTIGEDFVLSGTVKVFQAGAEIVVFPNPFHDKVRFEIKGLQYNDGEVRIFDIAGVELLRKSFGESRFEINTRVLPYGLYFYKIYQDGTPIAAGKLLRK